MVWVGSSLISTGVKMTATPETQQFLKRFTTEKLPEYPMGSSEVPGDPPSFTTDARYVPLRDPAHTA